MMVSVFKNFNQVEANLDISVILEQIRSGKYKSRIQALRELLRQGKTEKYSSAKRSLPAFTPSGLFEGGRKLEFLKEYSGLIILDIDKLSQEKLIAIRTRVEEIPNTYACFISPSGNGLKILVKVFSRPVYHKVVFNQVKAFYEEQLRTNDQAKTVQIDPSGKDITRLCFVSWDEMLYLNPSAAIFKPYINMVEDDIEKLVAQIESKRIDLTANYDDWVKIGFALVDATGEEGRACFHRLSQFYPGYNPKECDEQYDKCLKSKNSSITIATLFYLARDSGMDISKLATAPKAANTSPPADPISGETTNESQLKKKKRKNQIDTIEAYLSSHYQLRYNIVTSRLEIRPIACLQQRHCEERSDEANRFVPLTDYTENSLLRELLKNNLKCSASLLRSILYSDYSNFYDPFREYFLHLPLWDGQTDHIQQLAETVTTTSHDLWCTCFKKWLVATVAAVLDSKTVNHTAIILSGPQGVGKTTWMLNLCPPELSDYIFSGTINPNNKDTLIHLAECMFINMDELENMNRTEIGAFRNCHKINVAI